MSKHEVRDQVAQSVTFSMEKTENESRNEKLIEVT